METVHEIRRAFANLTVGHFMFVKLSDDYDMWIYRKGDSFGVAVDIDDERIVFERFATAKMYTCDERIAGEAHHLLVLENNEESLRNEFAAICAQFADPGSHGEYRKKLCSEPSEWWSKWKKLLGNSVREKTTQGMLGELLVYRILIELGKKPLWTGPTKHSHDLETEKVDYEVKSTIARYGTAITISGQHQLHVVNGKSLKIAFCRFEEVSSGGHTIEEVVVRLKDLGEDGNELEKKLSSAGFEKGCSARMEHFVLHEGIRLYDVDQHFPRITPDTFVGGMIPERIIQLTYQVDLTSLSYGLLVP